MYFILRWYILGKHSNLEFKENINTESGPEINLLNDTKCLTAQIRITFRDR